MRLDELFNGGVEYKIDKETEKVFSTSAKIGTRKISFFAERVGDAEHDTWEISFMQPNARDGKIFSLTGAGNEIEVMNLIKRSLEDFAERYKPKQFQFTSSSRELSRGKLYSRMLKRYAPSNYEYSEEIDDGWTGDALFILRRKG